jgi:hypothetical protein
MTAMSQDTRQQICTCDPAAETRTYYVWLLTSEKRKVSDVVRLCVTRDQIVLEKHSHEAVVVPRYDVFMVTCDVCSPPPCN